MLIIWYHKQTHSGFWPNGAIYAVIGFFSMKQNNNPTLTVVTAGSTYLDIDAYACAVALSELLRLRGENALASPMPSPTTA